MAKQGMKRPEITGGKPKNTVSPVPQLQGKAKTGHSPARPIIAGTAGATQKVYHSRPYSTHYTAFDNDLARDNLENDIPFADLQDP